MVKVVLNIFLSIFHFFLRVFKKALCCLKRRRRPSCEGIPLTNVGVVPNSDKAHDFQSWGAWDEMPTIVTDCGSKPVDPIQQKIEQYREQRMVPVEAGNPEENIDFFQDMAPKIVKQKKILLQTQETDQCLTKSNFSLAPDPTFHTSELGVWDDSKSWEDQTENDWDTNQILREKKRLDRERRLADHQRKKQERELQGGRSIIATKIS